MNKFFFLTFLLLLFTCQKRKPLIENVEAIDMTQVQIDSLLTKFKFQYELPILIENTNQILIPISTELLEKRSSYSSDGYSEPDFPRYWNILFYNRETGKTNLLTKEKFRISEIYANKTNSTLSDYKYRQSVDKS